MMKTLRLRQGVSFIEILISLFILSLACLGFARAQLALIRYDSEAYLSSVAHLRLVSIANRLRADPRHINAEWASWQQINKPLLPESEAEITGENPYKIQLRWHEREVVRTLSTQVFLNNDADP